MFHFECTSSYISDTGIGCGALPLDDIKFGPFFTFPAAAVDNYTRAPIEPAVKSVSWLELANWVTLTMVCLPFPPSTCLHKNPFYSTTVGVTCVESQQSQTARMFSEETLSRVVRSVRETQPRSPALIQPDTWAVVKILARVFVLTYRAGVFGKSQCCKCVWNKRGCPCILSACMPSVQTQACLSADRLKRQRRLSHTVEADTVSVCSPSTRQYMNQWKPVGIKCEAGRKRGRGRRESGSTFQLEGPVLFLSSGSTPSVTVQVLCEEEKGPPTLFFLCVRVKTELTAELILIVYSLELKTGNPSVCELLCVWLMFFFFQLLVYFSDIRRKAKKMIKMWHNLIPTWYSQTSPPDYYRICKLKNINGMKVHS